MFQHENEFFKFDNVNEINIVHKAHLNESQFPRLISEVFPFAIQIYVSFRSFICSEKGINALDESLKGDMIVDIVVMIIVRKSRS